MLASYILDLQTAQSQRKGLSNLYGFDANGDRQGVNLLQATTNSITCCMPLFSGVVGVLAEKMLPVGMLNDDIRIEITFDTSANALYSAGSATYTVNAMELELCVV
jgi:hypothetical protein